MPPIPTELKLLLDSLIAQIQQLQTRSDAIDALRNIQGVQEERIRRMSEEINELKAQLNETKEAILKNQQENFRRTIYVQGSILFLVLSTVIGIAVKFLFH